MVLLPMKGKHSIQNNSRNIRELAEKESKIRRMRDDYVKIEIQTNESLREKLVQHLSIFEQLGVPQ